MNVPVAHDHPDLVLERLGLVLPAPPPPIANYRPWTREGPLLFISGQVSTGPGGDLTGVVGETATLEEGVTAARLCGLNLLSQMKAAIGDLADVQCVLKVTGFVKAAVGFGFIPNVVDGCSALLIEVLGEAGLHARSAIGVAELPGGCLVEVDAIVRVAERA